LANTIPQFRPELWIWHPSWILESHAQKISRNYGIVLAEINRRSTAPPDTIFFLYLTGKKIGAKGKHLNIELASKQAQSVSILNMEPDNQTRMESQYQQCRIYYVNELGTRRKQSPLDHDITIKTKHTEPPLDYEITTIIYRKQLK
jgi:hypothetical protein